MVATTSEIVAPIGSGEHLKGSLKNIKELLKEISQTSIIDKFKKDKEIFDKAHKKFLQMSPELSKSYFNENLEEVTEFYDRWLDVKPKLFRSIDAIILKQQSGIAKFYQSESGNIDPIRCDLHYVAKFHCIQCRGFRPVPHQIDPFIDDECTVEATTKHPDRTPIHSGIDTILKGIVGMGK